METSGLVVPKDMASEPGSHLPEPMRLLPLLAVSRVLDGQKPKAGKIGKIGTHHPTASWRHRTPGTGTSCTNGRDSQTRFESHPLGSVPSRGVTRAFARMMPVSGASKKLCKGSSRTTRSSAPSAASRWKEKVGKGAATLPLVRCVQGVLEIAFCRLHLGLAIKYLGPEHCNVPRPVESSSIMAMPRSQIAFPLRVAESYGPALWPAFSSAKLFSSCGLVFDASWSINLASCVAGPKESQVEGYEKLLVLAATCRNCYVVLPKKVCAVKHPMH